MDIISKKSGPRREDVQAKKYINQNWGTIEKLADQISGGRYSADKKRRAASAPQASGKIIIDQAVRTTSDKVKPYLRISVNGRVVLADQNSGKQLHFLGQIKRLGGVRRFIIATLENGFLSPVEDEIYTLISDLADAVIDQNYSENDLEQELQARLEMN